ncbi:MAG: hypothetical protein WB676_32030 [Bryobacteraceae bacterium]
MQDSGPGQPPSATATDNRLDSWKEIAAYLNRDVTTVQRWEKRERMPVHRHLHDRVGSVYAFRTDLDEWVRTRNSPSLQVDGNKTVAQNLSEPEIGTQAVPAKSATPNKWKFVLAQASIAAALATIAGLWLEKRDYFWRNPIAGAHFEAVTDFEGMQESAAISRDGRFIAFLSDRDGATDIWLTQVGSGEFHNLTKGSIQGLANPSLRVLAFSPDGSLVTFWDRKHDGSSTGKISIWAVPTLGGQPRLYLEGVAEFDWSHDSSRLAYHTPASGDPLFVSGPAKQTSGGPILRMPGGLHAHFPLWAPDDAFIYVVQGALPDKLDIWRIDPHGGTHQRITSHRAAVSYPTPLSKRTLLYLATNSDGSGPSVYGITVDHRIPHRLTSALDRYTSLAASADARHLVATRAIPNTTLWRLPIDAPPGKIPSPDRIPLTTRNGFSPRYGQDYLLFVSAVGGSDSIWKLSNGTAAELWSGADTRVVGCPEIAPDGRLIAFSVQRGARTLLYVIQPDGADARVVSDSLALEGSLAWTPDAQWITSAAQVNGVPQLFRISVNGGSSARLVKEYSVDPSWAPDGRFVLYTGPDIGTTFPVKAATADGASYPLWNLTLTRGARRLKFLPGTRELAFLRGDIQHKDLWALDLLTGTERQLTNLPPGFDIRDFDVSVDGREAILQRFEERSEVLLIDLAP